MLKTINAYAGDQGEVVVTISTENAAAIAAFTTTEDIIVDGAVVSFKRTNNPARQFETTKVTGHTDGILTVGDTVESENWDLVLIDDFYEGDAGEWGTDLLSAVEIFQEFFDNRPETPGGIAATPAGGATGDIEISLSADAEILSVSRPEIDANVSLPNTVTVSLACSSSSTAAHT